MLSAKDVANSIKSHKFDAQNLTYQICILMVEHLM